MSDTGDEIDLHQLCIQGDSRALKSALNSSTNVDVNQYKLFIVHRTSNSSMETEDDFQWNDDDSSTIFDYRSPLFCAILHNHLTCVQLLIEHGANGNKLRWTNLSASFVVFEMKNLLFPFSPLYQTVGFKCSLFGVFSSSFVYYWIFPWKSSFRCQWNRSMWCDRSLF